MPVSAPVHIPSRPAALRPRSAGGFIIFHPRYRAWLVRRGLDTSTAVLGLRGEIVCGHPDRHVVRVELEAGTARRVVYMKTEHVVGWRVRLKNWRAGFGWVSRGEREAATLTRLEAAGLPGPQWLAYGEDGRGQAFLLVDELDDAADSRAVLSDIGLSADERRLAIERAGRAVAELHEAGFGTPELAAKHLLIARDSGTVTLLDWQSAPRPGLVSDADRARQLAGLMASLSPELADPHDRLRFLWAYRRVVRAHRRAPSSRFGSFARAVLASAAKRRNRSSVRDQRHAATQRLVWLAGEAVCVIPELVDVWPTPAVAAPFYPNLESVPASPQEWITFPTGERALLTRFTTVAPLGRLAARLRGKPWRSPGATAARLLFHLERFGIAAPRLLAFGQRLTSPTRAESFVLYQPCSLGHADTRLHTFAERCAWLRDCGSQLRRLHDAGCRLSTRHGEPPFEVSDTQRPRAVLESPFAVQLDRNIDATVRRADLRRLLRHAISRSERARIIHGYTATDSPEVRRTLLKGVV